MTGTDLGARVAAIAGAAIATTRHLAQGHNAELTLLTLTDGRRLVAKAGHGLEPEGFMLRHLAGNTALPVPALHHADDRLLVMDYVENDGRITAAAQTHAADLLAALHATPAPRYGFPRSTPIGPLAQDNTEDDDWVAFFRDRRLLAMARAAVAENRIDGALMSRLERLAERLDTLIGPPAPPALVHGDLWSGNLLVRDGEVAAMIDPAIHYADPEVELAFTTLFGTFGDAFFRRYHEMRPIRPDFFEVRRDLYNLYPLLVHVRLYGGGYRTAVDRTVRRFIG